MRLWEKRYFNDQYLSQTVRVSAKQTKKILLVMNDKHKHVKEIVWKSYVY